MKTTLNHIHIYISLFGFALAPIGFAAAASSSSSAPAAAEAEQFPLVFDESDVERFKVLPSDTDVLVISEAYTLAGSKLELSQAGSKIKIMGEIQEQKIEANFRLNKLPTVDQEHGKANYKVLLSKRDRETNELFIIKLMLNKVSPTSEEKDKTDTDNKYDVRLVLEKIANPNLETYMSSVIDGLIKLKTCCDASSWTKEEYIIAIQHYHIFNCSMQQYNGDASSLRSLLQPAIDNSIPISSFINAETSIKLLELVPDILLENLNLFFSKNEERNLVFLILDSDLDIFIKISELKIFVDQYE